MVKSLAWWVLVACGPADVDPVSPVTDPSTEPSTSTVTPKPEPKTTSSTPTEGGVVVTALTSSAGPRSNQFVLSATTSAPSPVAAWCVREGHATEQLLVESSEPLTDHELRVSGLLPGESYTCQVVATDPTAEGVRSTMLSPGEPPRPLTSMEVEVDESLGMTGAWTLIAKAHDEATTYLVIYGPDGHPRWWHPVAEDLLSIEALYHPEDDVIVWGGGNAPSGRPGTVGLWTGESQIDPPDWELSNFHHDGVRLSDGRFLTLEDVENQRDGVTFEGFKIRIYDAENDTVDFTVDSQRYVDENALPPGAQGDDVYHANWVHYDELDDPTLYVSLCNARRIIAINGVTGELRWQLGSGLGWLVRDEEGALASDALLPRCQHGLEVNGTEFLIYDNGRGRRQSNAAIWQIDGDRRSAQRVWSWTEEDWFSPALGDVDWLSDDRVLVTMARFGPPQGNTEIVEVDVPTSEVASRTWFATDGRAYRSERYEGCTFFDRVDLCPEREARFKELADRFSR